MVLQRILTTITFLSLLLLVACANGAAEEAGYDAATPDDAGITIDAGPVVDAAPVVDAELEIDASCEPPDLLIVLDRTMSMHKRPDGTRPPNTLAGHAQTKWYLAIDAIKQTTESLDTAIRFGLELFPSDPGGNTCITLSARINGRSASNSRCEGGEVMVSPQLDTSDQIAASLDPETTRLCQSTPIAAGLATATIELAAVQDPIREQHVVLITDGQDTCSGSTALSLEITQELAAVGVRVYVIGFDASGSGVNRKHLNKLACAGRTASISVCNST